MAAGSGEKLAYAIAVAMNRDENAAELMKMAVSAYEYAKEQMETENVEVDSSDVEAEAVEADGKE